MTIVITLDVERFEMMTLKYFNSIHNTFVG